jgi:hypothetical protein
MVASSVCWAVGVLPAWQRTQCGSWFYHGTVISMHRAEVLAQWGTFVLHVCMCAKEGCVDAYPQHAVPGCVWRLGTEGHCKTRPDTVRSKKGLRLCGVSCCSSCALHQNPGCCVLDGCCVPSAARNLYHALKMTSFMRYLYSIALATAVVTATGASTEALK